MLFDEGHVNAPDIESAYDRVEDVEDEAPTMHVKVGRDPLNEWHRIMISTSMPYRHGSDALNRAFTACELPIGGSYFSTRDETYEGPLCTRGCFTTAELKASKRIQEEAIARAHADAEAQEHEAIARARTRTEERERRQRALDLVTGKVPRTPLDTGDGDGNDDDA